MNMYRLVQCVYDKHQNDITLAFNNVSIEFSLISFVWVGVCVRVCVGVRACVRARACVCVCACVCVSVLQVLDFGVLTG